MNQLKLQQLLRQFFMEDIGERDITSETIFPDNEWAAGTFTAKEDGVLAGTDIIVTGYRLLHPDIDVTLHKRDGEQIKKGKRLPLPPARSPRYWRASA